MPSRRFEHLIMSKHSFLFVALALFMGCKTSSSVKPVKLELYVMSQCPYGVQVMNAVAPVAKKLGESLALEVNYIGTKDGDALNSMHGPDEVKGDIAQLCVKKLAPKGFLDFVVCQNKSWKDVASNWRACAKDGGASVDKLEKCIEGEDGKALLSASFAVAEKREARGSPTIFLNDKPYTGGRRERDFMSAICAEFSGEKPEVCAKLPVSPKVMAIFFSDKRCPKCDVAPLEPRLRSEFPGLAVTSVDYASEDGKKLYDELRAAEPSFRFLPAVLFDESVKKDVDGHKAVERYLRPVGKYFILAIGAKFDPTAEICDNKVDDDGDGAIDCADDGCKEDLVCRVEKPKRLDLFVMSQCPYGAMAIIAMQEVLAAFGGELDLGVRFVGDERDGELYSMHGPAEVEEDMRQACAVKHYGAKHKFMSYLACRAKDYSNNDADVLTACVEKDGKALLREDFKLASGLGINASPTFLANNKHIFNGVAAEAIKQKYCEYNEGLAGCKKTLSAGQGGGGGGDGACQ